MSWRPLFVVTGLAALFMVSACDSVEVDTAPLLVVEAYVVEGQPMPHISVRRTHGLSTPRDELMEGVDNATVTMTLNEQPVPYSSHGSGMYKPDLLNPPVVQSGDRFEVSVIQGGHEAWGAGTVPPALHITSVQAFPAEFAIPAVLVDTLLIGIDSLDLGLDVARGYVYPVEVDVAWERRPDTWWLEARLVPDDAFSSSILDFFLLPNAVFPENRPVTSVWRGVYVVPVPFEDSPFPHHEVLVALVRGDSLFASWANSRANTRTRTLTGNVSGALGYVGGIAVDSIRLELGAVHRNRQ